MGRLVYYKRYPAAALKGFAVLNLEERGAYDTLLDLIYAHDGAVQDDPKFLAGWMRCDVRVWKRIRQRLLDLEKIYIHADKIRNPRADEEIDKALGRGLSAREAGLASAATRAATAKLIKDLGLTTVQREVQPLKDRKKDNTTTFLVPREEGSAEKPESEAVRRMRERLERKQRA